MSLNIDNILEGWHNFIFKSEVTEQLKKERAKHCIDCKHKKFSKTLKAFIKDDVVEVEGFRCNKCKCPLSAKLLSKNENCPLKLW